MGYRHYFYIVEKGECITGAPSVFDDYEEFSIDMYYDTCQINDFKQ